MTDQFSRTRLLLGMEAMEKLRKSRVAVFGIGGVGGYAVEALARSGIGTLDLIDHDRVSVTNLNRQLIATGRTIGQYKADAAETRVHEINPECKVYTYKTFFMPETQDLFDFALFDYVVDAIDTVKGKLALISAARAAGTPIISSMGTGNKTDPTAFRVADIYETSVCPLARVIRSECRKRGIDGLKVVYSTEIPIRPEGKAEPEEGGNTVRKDVPGSTAFVPGAAGLILAGAVVMDLVNGTGRSRERNEKE